MKTEATLTSLKLQSMINLDTLDTDLWCPVLRFGNKKENRFSFPIVFKDYNQAEKLCNELLKLKGQTITEVQKSADNLYEQFKKHHYKN